MFNARFRFCLDQNLPPVEKAGFLPSLNDLIVLGGGDVDDSASLSKLFEDVRIV